MTTPTADVVVSNMPETMAEPQAPSTQELFAPVSDLLLSVEQRLLEIEPGQHESITAATTHLVKSGGKRVRPAMTLLFGKMLGVSEDRLINLAAAIEMLHTATLVHDDLLDGALLRRGIPTLNADWTPAATILTGDYLFARAAGLAADTDSVGVMKLFAKALRILINGEIRQMFISKAAIGRDDYFKRIYAKTASMFELATDAAAVLADVSETEAEALHQFGYDFGVAFQIIDDILDYVGNSEKVGKPVGGDLKQGLFTLPVLYYLDENPDDENVAALRTTHKGDRKLVAQIVADVNASGAVQDAHNEARDFIAKAIEGLQIFPDSIYRQALIDVANYSVNRDL